MSFKTESRKEPNVLLLDFGTLFVKGSVLENSTNFHDYNGIIRNQVFYISEKKAETLEAETKGEVHISPGYFTLREIEDAKMLFQAENVYVQLDAIPKSKDILAKAYQNICEQLEDELQLEKKIVPEPFSPEIGGSSP